MIKLLKSDTSGAVPYPEADNLMLDDLDGLETQGGYSLAGKFPMITIALSDGYDTPSGLVDYLKVGLLNVVSSKLKQILEAIEVEFEYFPTKVLYHDKPTSIKYFVANPLRRIKAIDLNHSDVDLDEELGDALSVRKLVLDESKLTGIKMAVIDELQRIGVQPDVVALIEHSGCTGCTFVDPITIRY